MDRLMHLRESLGESPEIVALVTLLVVFIFFAFAAPNFLTVFALSNILTFGCCFSILHNMTTVSDIFSIF